jgi:hypothetical protein
VVDKVLKRGGCAIHFEPNKFSLRAVYRGNAGQWIQREVLDTERLHFNRVVIAKSDFLALEFRPHHHIVHAGWEQPGDFEKLEKRLNKPFTMMLLFVQGVPRIKEMP